MFCTLPETVAGCEQAFSMLKMVNKKKIKTTVFPMCLMGIIDVDSVEVPEFGATPLI